MHLFLYCIIYKFYLNFIDEIRIISWTFIKDKINKNIVVKKNYSIRIFVFYPFQNVKVPTKN